MKEKSQSVDTEHVNLFNPKSIEILLKKNNFKVLEIFTPGRLDAEIVRDEVLKGSIKLGDFLNKILIDEWDKLGWSFQKFLAENNLSSHMWVCAKKLNSFFTPFCNYIIATKNKMKELENFLVFGKKNG